MIPAPPAPGDALRLGYGTNGLTDLRLDDALGLLADLGYDGVGLTLDHMHLDPLAPDLPARTRKAAHRLERLGLSVAVETGARYVLDPRRKHHPTLLDPDADARGARIALLLKAVRVGADLGAYAVHCFSGKLPPGVSPDTGWQRLAESIAPVVAAADAAGVPLAVEPEPGHLLSDIAGFHRLRTALGAPAALGLTLDLGHCQCLEPASPADCVRAVAPWLRHVQIEDMRRGVHEHLPFGEGEIDFPPVLAALREAGYGGLVGVELPRDSHRGPELAGSSYGFLKDAEARSRALPTTAAGAATGAATVTGAEAVAAGAGPVSAEGGAAAVTGAATPAGAATRASPGTVTGAEAAAVAVGPASTESGAGSVTGAGTAAGAGAGNAAGAGAGAGAAAGVGPAATAAGPASPGAAAAATGAGAAAAGTGGGAC